MPKAVSYVDRGYPMGPKWSNIKHVIRVEERARLYTVISFLLSPSLPINARGGKGGKDSTRERVKRLCYTTEKVLRYYTAIHLPGVLEEDSRTLAAIRGDSQSL